MTAKFTTVQTGPQCTGNGTVALTTAKTGSTFTPTTAGNMLLAMVLAPAPAVPFTPPDGNWVQLAVSAAGGAGRVETWMLPGASQPGGLTSVSFTLPAAQVGVNCHGGLKEYSLPAGSYPIIETVAVNSGQSAGFVGATTLPSGYGGDPGGHAPTSGRLNLANWVNTAASSVDGTTLAGPIAIHMQKWFLGSGTAQESGQQYILNSSPSTGGNPNGLPGDLLDLINAGTSVLLCVKPSQSLNGADPASPSGDYSHLATTVNILQQAMATAWAASPAWTQPPQLWVTVWQEPNGGSFSGSGPVYNAYYNYYAPAILFADAHPNWGLAGNPGLPARPYGFTPVGVDWATNHSTQGNYYQYYPGDQFVFFIVADMYGNTYTNGPPTYYLDQPNGLAQASQGGPGKSMMDYADQHLPYPVPFGVAELGMSQQGVTNYPVKNQFYFAGWASPGDGGQTQKPWMNYVGDVMAARLAAGKPVACINWFSGANNPEYNILPDGEILQAATVTSGSGGAAKFTVPGMTFHAGDKLWLAANTTMPGGFTEGFYFVASSPAPSGDVCYLAGSSGGSAISYSSAGNQAGFFVTAYDLLPGLNYIYNQCSKFAASLTGTATMPIKAGAPNAADSMALLAVAAFHATSPSGTWTVPSGYTQAAHLASSAPSVWQMCTADDLSAGTQALTATAAPSYSAVTKANGWAAVLTTLTAAVLSITTTSLPNGKTGTAYTKTGGNPVVVTATQGTTPYTFAVTAGSLPAGLLLDGDGSATGTAGTIHGTPTGAVTAQPVTITVTDANGVTAPGSFTITITSTAPVITTTAVTGGTTGTAYTGTVLAVTSGTSPYTWSVTAGALPPGLTLSTVTGAITGTPTAPGSYSPQFTVTDANGSTASATLTIIIVPAAGPAGGMAELQVLIGITWLFPQPMSVQGGTWQAATIHTPVSGAWN